MRRRICCALLAALLALAAGGVRAEGLPDCQGIHMDTERQVTTTDSYVQVFCPMPVEGDVTLSVASGGRVTYQRDWYGWSGPFSTWAIYLPLAGSTTLYTFTLQTPSDTYVTEVIRLQQRLTHNAACSAGYSLLWLNGRTGWQTATMLDLEALGREPMAVPLCASGLYAIGEAVFSLEEGGLSVSLRLKEEADVEVERAQVYAARTVEEAALLGREGFTGLVGTMDAPLDLGDARFAAVFVELTVSFDPTVVSEVEALQLEGQEEIWLSMQTGMDANG